MPKKDEVLDKILSNPVRMFSVTGIQMERNVEGNVLQYFIPAEDPEEAYKKGQREISAILGSNSIVKVCEVGQ
jgi:hypothetical protein